MSENADIGVATVRSSDAGFAGDVARSGAIVGATTNRVIGRAPRDGAKLRRDAIEKDVGSRRGDRGHGKPGKGADPLAAPQWDMQMIGATADGSYRAAGLEGGPRRRPRHRHRLRATRTSRRTSMAG